jgi:hypothetical protein
VPEQFPESAGRQHAKTRAERLSCDSNTSSPKGKIFLLCADREKLVSGILTRIVAFDYAIDKHI